MSSNVSFHLFRKSPWLPSPTLSSINKRHIKKTKPMNVQNSFLITLRKPLKYHLLNWLKKLDFLFSQKSQIKELKRNLYKQSIFNSQLKEFKISSKISSTLNKSPGKKSKKFLTKSITDSERWKKSYCNILNSCLFYHFISFWFLR